MTVAFTISFFFSWERLTLEYYSGVLHSLLVLDLAIFKR